MDISVSAIQLKERKLLRVELLSRVLKRKEIGRGGKRRRMVPCIPVYLIHDLDFACFRLC